MNPLDLNIDDIDEDIQIKSKIKLTKSSKVNNIFYPNINNIKNRFSEGITKDNLYKEFNAPYIICVKDDINFESFFHEKMISEDELDHIKKSIKIIPVKYSSISESMYNYFIIMSAPLFNSFNVKDKYNKQISAVGDVLACCLFRFKSVDIYRYLKQYEGVSDFVDIYNGLLINEYFGVFSSKLYRNQIILIDNMTETNYWTIYNNCKLNYTTKFRSNSFNLSINERLTDKNIDNVIKYLISTKDDNDYLAFLFKKSNYVDASSGIDANGYKLYTISSNIIITVLDFNKIFDKLMPDVQYHLIMSCLISKELCHLIINNQYILGKIMSNEYFLNNFTFMELYGQILRYTMGYAWLTMYIEESIKRSYAKITDRFIFNIDTASLLPWFPYSIENIHICPYLPILVSNETLNISKNILGVEQHIYLNLNQKAIDKTRYGVCTKDIFIQRINQFISGKNDFNILNDINWNNIAISGSIMAGCLPNYNTLMSKFIIDKTSFNIDFVEFINEYYKEADIDVMCNIKDIFLFVDKINEFNNQLQINIKAKYEITTELNISKIFTNKSASILIDKNFINQYLIDKIQLSNIEIISDLNNPSIKDIIYTHYIEWHKDFLKKSATDNPDKFFDPKYHEIYIPVPITEINIILINNTKTTDTPDTIQTTETTETNPIFIPKINYKFRISSRYLPHNFEFFQIKYDDFLSTVSQFHLPIVRAYYDGNDVYLTTACISACMTLINIDRKYFAGKTDPIEIINKYRMRGFGTILNQREITKLIEYSNLVPKWKKLYKLNINSHSSIMNIVGVLSIDNLFFRPSLILDDKQQNSSYVRLIINTDYQIIPFNIVEVFTMIKKLYNIHNRINYDLTTINKYGFINTVKKWLINAFNDVSINQLFEIIN